MVCGVVHAVRWFSLVNESLPTASGDRFVVRMFKRLLLVSEPPTSRNIFLRAAIVFGLMFGVCLAYSLWEGSLNAPPYPTSDGHDYHHLAVRLSQGEAYAYDWTNPASKAVYHPFDINGKYEEVLTRAGVGATTQRPPGYPALLAMIYAIAGPSFMLARLANFAMMALAAAIAVAFAERRGGSMTAIVAAGGMLVVDPLLIWHTTLVMTESMAALLVMLVIVSAASAMRQPNWRVGLLTGGLFGLLTLVRPNFTVWLPLIGLILAWCFFRDWRKWSQPERRRNLSCLLAMGAAVLVVACPWWIRNCNTTGRFTPLGTLGSQSLAGAYGDAALNHFGNWQSDSRALAAAKLDPDFANASYAENEYQIGVESQKLASHWIAENYHWLPYLWLARMASLFGLFHPLDLIRFVLLLIGAIVVWRWPGGRLLVLAVAINAFVVALTWSHYGRFLAPLRPIVNVIAAAAIVAMVAKIMQKAGNFNSKRLESASPT